MNFDSWICIIMLGSRVMPSCLLTWNAIAALSEECVAKLVHGVRVATHIVVSSALER